MIISDDRIRQQDGARSRRLGEARLRPENTDRRHCMRGPLRRASLGCGLLPALTASSVLVRAAQDATLPTLAGMWRLRETTGELPEHAVRALDGATVVAGTGVTIRIDQSDVAVTVRRLGDPAVPLRVMSFAAEPREHLVPGGGLLKGRAEWRDRAVVAEGQVAVKRGFLKRNVPFEEVWQLDEAGRTLRVTTTLKTPLGVKRRTQVFMRVAEDAPLGREVVLRLLPVMPPQNFLPPT